jgi:hypothetical protein
MREALVSLPTGAGVVRAEHGLLVTEDVSRGGGTYLRETDRFHPVKTWFDQDRSVVGGLLPPGAVSAEVIDDRTVRVEAEVAGGAYAALIDQPNDGYEAIVCCRNASGQPVRRPWAADYPSVRVTDAQDRCPACGEIDWEEYTPFEDWRGGGGSEVDGTYETSPIVSCRVCGHEEPEGRFFGRRSTAETSESEEQRAARIARVRAELLKQRWLSDSLTLRAANSPIYGVEGWSARLGGTGSHGDTLTEITVHHYESADAQPLDGDKPILTVVTRHEEQLRFSLLEVARQALEGFVRRTTVSGDWPDASHAAITLFLRAQDRNRRAVVLAAGRSQDEMSIDGTPAEVLMLTVPDGRWTAAARHADLTITVSGRNAEPLSLRLEPIGDPATALLGPEPPDA